MTDTRNGVLALIAACCIWGLSGLFYKTLIGVPPHEVLAHRTFWSLVFFGLVLGLQGRLHVLWRAVSNWTSFKVIAAAALFISTNSRERRQLAPPQPVEEPPQCPCVEPALEQHVERQTRCARRPPLL